MGKSDFKKNGKTVFKVSLKERPDFKDELIAFIFDSVGNLLALAPIKGENVVPGVVINIFTKGGE